EPWTKPERWGRSDRVRSSSLAPHRISTTVRGADGAWAAEPAPPINEASSRTATARYPRCRRLGLPRRTKQSAIAFIESSVGVPWACILRVPTLQRRYHAGEKECSGDASETDNR